MVDRRIQDHLISSLDPGIHFYAGAQIALYSHLADLSFTIADNCDLRSVAVEMIASAGTETLGVLRGIWSSTVQ
jgi:hypothetical protein